MDKNTRKKIMILAAPIGSGHIRAAMAIKEQLLKETDVQVTVYDIFDIASGFLGKSLLSIYFFLLKNIPSSYHFLYKWGDTSSSLRLRSLVNWIFARKWGAFLKVEKPDLVISTHVTPAGIISLYKKKTGSKLPLFGVVTDYAMHKWWLYDEINAYIVFDKDMFAGYENFLQENQFVWDFGIPAHEEFNEYSNEKHELRERLGLPQQYLVGILSGGGEGFLPMQEIIENWRKTNNSGKNIFWVAICGKNNALHKQLSKLNLDNVKVLAYVNDICDYMKAADFIVSKGGGITITEAMNLALPIILYKPLPGQEYMNTEYLLRKNVVVKAENAQELCAIVSQEDVLKDMQHRQAAFAKPYAAGHIAKKIYAFMD